MCMYVSHPFWSCPAYFKNTSTYVYTCTNLQCTYICSTIYTCTCTYIYTWKNQVCSAKRKKVQTWDMYTKIYIPSLSYMYIWSWGRRWEQGYMAIYIHVLRIHKTNLLGTRKLFTWKFVQVSTCGWCFFERATCTCTRPPSVAMVKSLVNRTEQLTSGILFQFFFGRKSSYMYMYILGWENSMFVGSKLVEC